MSDLSGFPPADDVLDRLRAIVAGVLETAPEAVEDDALFFEDLALDSLEKTEIVVRAEKEFRLTLGADEAALMRSVEESAAVLRERLDAAAGTGVDPVGLLLGGHLARGRGDRTACTDPDAGDVSYARLHTAAARYAGQLAGAGVPSGTRGLIVADDSVATVTAVLGLWWHGCVPVVISPMLTDDEVRHVAADCAAAVVHLDATPKRQQALEALLGGLPLIRGADVRAALDGDAPADGPPPVTWPEGREALVQYTSGSTGLLKGVRHRAGALTAALAGFGSVLGLREDDTVLSTARMSFGYGFGSTVLYPLAAGARTVLLRGAVDVHSVTAAVGRHRPTVLWSVPRLYAALADAGGVPAGTVRLCVAAGEHLAAPLGERVRTAFGAELVNGLGATEVLHIVVATPPGRPMPGTIGLPVPGVTATVRDADGRPVPDGTEGRLHIAGPTVALGYIGRPDAAARTFADGGVYTGDIAVRRDDGTVVHLCRADDLLNLGGYKVVPGEIEAVAREVAGVKECVVVGTTDGDGLQQAVLYAVPAPGADTAAVRRAITAALRGRLAPYKRPARVEFLTELPVTSTGKLAAFRLRALEEDAGEHRLKERVKR
ncbi:AMP-binding protein [Streptomyces sp. AV19]|uniref:AMP-binding protein n=1 Tax=Streptomyces sp. AV19 TaxID=2793068 RepID=UPI0018FEC277|nr:AMP-binding protein [Streptomyces sp. AV19]MBH1938811.1 AMP-binding protein [Streptomyces sp. AV19]MDG4534744.1 AMP-binding protein [Streptomyces sp. AV19]